MEAQEENMKHVKRERSYEAESSSPSTKRMPSAVREETKWNRQAHKLLLHYKQILPDLMVEKKSLEGGGSSSKELHFMLTLGIQRWCVCVFLFIQN